MFDDIDELARPDVNLLFARLIERNVVCRQDAEIFCDLQKEDIQHIPEIDEMRISFILQYMRPIIKGTGTHIHATIAEFTPPFGIGNGVDIYGIIATHMKPVNNTTPYKSAMDRYKPYTGTSYALSAMSVLVDFIIGRLTVIGHTILLDHDRSLTTAIQVAIAYPPIPQLPMKELSIDLKRITEIKAANIAYNLHEIRMRVLLSYAWQKYNKSWAALDAHAKQELLFDLNKRDEQMRRQRENNCGHKLLLAALTISVDRSKRAGARLDLVQAAYAELAKYFAPVKLRDDPIVCANCTYPIMCPHYDMYCRTLSMSLVAKYFGESKNSVFTCRVCDEYLVYSVELAESLDVVSRQGYLVGDDITKLITKTCSFLLFQYILTPMRNFTEIIMVCCDNILPKARRRISGKFVKFFTLDKIDQYTQIVIAAHCVGFLVRVLMQYEDVHLRTTIDIPDTPKGRLVGFLQYFYGVLSRIYNQQILSVMTLEEFGQLIYDAYKSLNAPLILTDITLDIAEHDFMGICDYVAYITGRPATTRDATKLKLAKLHTPYLDRIRHPITPDEYGMRNGRINPPKTQVLTLPDYFAGVRHYDISSGAVYDTKGRPHLWILDVCQICGARREDVCATNVDDAVFADGLSESFYNTFAINCPEGEHHTGLPCAKCGMGDMYDISIIAKYGPQYRDMLRSDLIPIHPVRTTTYTQPTWNINKHILNEFEKLYSVPSARIRNLGLISGTLLRAIESGDAVPWQNPENNRTQGNVLFQYTTIMSATYSSLRQASHDAVPAIRAMIGAHPDEVALLPDLPPLDYTTYTKLNDDIFVNYMFTYLLGTLIWFNKPGLLKLFGRYFVAYIFEYDAVFAKTDLQLQEYTETDYGIEPDPSGDEPDDAFDDIDTDDMKTNMGFAE